MQSLLGKKILSLALLFLFSILGAKSTSAQTPAITTQPASQTVTVGQSATFTAVVSNGPCRSLWLINGKGYYGSFSSTISYTIQNTTLAMNGWTVAVNLYGCGSTGTNLGNSQIAILTVNSAALAPSIATQPANQNVNVGQSATLGVAAGGTAPLSYQWHKNGAMIGGATSASYTTPAATSADNGSTFHVVVSNSAGNITSSAATLTVNPAVVAPTITTQPLNQTVTAGQTATFSMVASGTAPLSYQWQKNSANITGATSASYTTPATTNTDNGSTFQVVVSNSAGRVTSTAATITVNRTTGAPSIAQQPQSQTVQPGQSATFTAVISNGPCRSLWSINGAAQYGSFASTISYTIPNATLAMNGWNVFVNLYDCGSTGTNLGNSQIAILTVNSPALAPSIVTQPANQTVTTGQTATFTVVASGIAPLSYQWQKNGAAISGATAASYTTPGTSSSDNGATFRVVVSNSAGSTTSNPATLTVTTDTTPPTVSITSPTSGATVSGTITVTASASDDVAVASVQLQVDGTNVGPADTTAPYDFSLDSTTLSNGSHSLTAVATDTSGNQATSAAVSVTVSNQAGNAAPTYANNGAGCPITTVPGGPSDEVVSYNCPLPNPTGAGNLLVLWLRYTEGANTPVVSFTDNVGGNTYLQATSCTDASQNNTISRLYYVQNITAGVNLVTVHFSIATSTRMVQMQPYEFYNVATTSALDQAVCQVSGGTSISTGLLPDLSASGDLVVQFGFADNGTATTSCSKGSQSNITWTMRASVISSTEPMCFQYGVYNSTASFSPTMTFGTSVNYISLAAAFKAASAGTPPPSSGIRVAYVQHDNGGSLNATSFKTELPISGNLGVEVFTSACGTNVLSSCNYASSISDGTNSWALLGSTFLTNTGSPQEEIGQIWYVKNAVAGLYQFTATTNPAGSIEAAFPQTWIFYDIVGASSNPVDTGFGGAGTGLATFNSINSSGPITTFTVTPSAPNEVIITGAGYEFNNMTGLSSPPAGSQFVAATYVDANISSANETYVDANGGYALLYNGASTAAETWTWTHDTAHGPGSGRGLAIGAAFK